MSQAPKPAQPGQPVERFATVIETDEDVRQALLSGARGQAPGVAAGPIPGPTPPAMSGRPASPFRPTNRPPVPILTVFDDGKADGEAIRIRETRFIIGRTEGDLRFPLDGRMSARHVEITHQLVGGLHRWVVTDLQSKHGLFVRVSRTALADRAELLVGNGRYRFEAGQPDPGATVDHVAPEPNFSETSPWSDGPGPARPPALTEMIGQAIGNRVLLVKPEYWIGSDPSCPISRPDDPFCEPRHARIYRGSKGGWHAEHNTTLNGLWLRMAQITVEAIIHFQVGEQRFRLRVP